VKTTIKLPTLFLFCAFSCLTFNSHAADALVQLNSQFNADEIKWVREPGDSSVSGKVFLTLKDGSKKGCAGFTIELLPVTTYSSERILKTYGNTLHGQVLLEDKPPKFTPDAKEYHELLLKSTCNAKNEFEFTQVPAGEYYVMAFIIWDQTSETGTIKTGGAVMKRIKVSPKSNVKI
jgi:hypothetical protein